MNSIKETSKEKKMGLISFEGMFLDWEIKIFLNYTFIKDIKCF